LSSSYIDVKYINLVSTILVKFKQNHTNLWNFRCPICGDSEKHQNKRRGFIYEKKNQYFYRCHNCDYGTSFSKFLEKVNPSLHKEYLTERYKEKQYESKTIIPKFNFTPKFNHVLQGLSTIDSLFDAHPAKSYLRKRKIPEKYFNKLYYCTNFKEWTNKVIPNKFRSIKQDTPRLVIPFFDSDNNVIGYQGRSFDPKDQCKYITIKFGGVENLIFGQERLDVNKKQYCVEGPLDSLFLPNCLAIAGLNFKGLKLNNIIVLDNEKRNKQIKEALSKLIIDGYSVCIWPDNIKEKDINEMILSDMTPEEIVGVVDDNTYSGLQAKFQLSRWSKC
tara:strand:+ start:173 stop:1168 length:996 start_codon:yes stop_codon:yes gene_type:complete